MGLVEFIRNQLSKHSSGAYEVSKKISSTLLLGMSKGGYRQNTPILSFENWPILAVYYKKSLL